MAEEIKNEQKLFVKEYRLPKKAIKTLIEFNEESLVSLNKSINNPLQQMFGTAHIELNILGVKSSLEMLKKELSFYESEERKILEK